LTFANNILIFHKNLKITSKLPEGVGAMNPYKDKIAFNLCTKFYQTFYSDINERTLIIGINPGRFGGGITGVPFTDPIKLEVNCGIKNDLPKKVELSADFIYKMIEAYGGAKKFYSKFYVTAVSPLGFVKDGKNLNYYDVKALQESILNFIVDCFEKQLTFGVNKKVCYCLGEGENFKFLSKLNQTHNFFETIIPLPHPRFIMQYRRKRIDEYVEKYLIEFTKVL
jgi:hypothetical protein